MTNAANEPTTGEIVFALICCGNCENCSVECYYLKRDCGDVLFDASARLKSQEQRIAELTEKLEGKESTLASLYPVMLSKGGTIAALTARAEQAEKERDDAVVNINLCMNGDICKACVSWKNGICSRKDNRCDPKYRGVQQQNGEEK